MVEFCLLSCCITILYRRGFHCAKHVEANACGELFGPAYKCMFRNAIPAVENYGEMYARNVEDLVPCEGRNILNSSPFGPQHYPLPGVCVLAPSPSLGLASM